MALSDCNVTVDKTQHELVKHGITMFPIACYDDDLHAVHVPWHWHDEFEFIIMTEGIAPIRIENQMLLVEPGDAVFINSEILHSIDLVKEASCRCHSLVFHGRLIGGSIESSFWQKLINPIMQDDSLRYLYLRQSSPWQKKVIEYMANAWQVIADETYDYENEARFYISKALRVLADHHKFTDKKVNKQENLYAKRVKTMIEYIEGHYAEEVTLQRIADSASISKSVCLRCFRQVIGSTPIQYLIQYRIEKAAERLESTDSKIYEVALNSGFTDFSYFTKCFREIKGCTPKEYSTKKKR